MSSPLHFPDQPISVGKAEYTLKGTFRTLASLEQAFSEDVIRLQSRVLDMRLDEFARLLAVAITASGGKATEDEIGQALLDEVGITTPAYAILRVTVLSWLRVALTDPEGREKKLAELGEMLAKAASPGETTSDSA